MSIMIFQEKIHRSANFVKIIFVIIKLHYLNIQKHTIKYNDNIYYYLFRSEFFAHHLSIYLLFRKTDKTILSFLYF